MFFKSTNAIIYFVLSTRHSGGDGRTDCTPTPDDYVRGEPCVCFYKEHTAGTDVASRRAVPRGL